jgi:5-hydroxyisourate hydrolase-like protein (transthyretin family)
VTGSEISGTVTSTTGALLSNVSVNAVDASPGAVCCTWMGGTVSNTTGTFKLRVPNGTYRIFFYPHATSYVPTWWNGASRFNLAANVVVSGADVAGINAQLVLGVPITGTITGTGGAPLAQAFVSAALGGTAACCTWVNGAVTNGLGQYSVIVPQNGTYRLRIQAQTGTYVPEWWDHKTRFDLATDIVVGTTAVTGKNAQLTAGYFVSGTVRSTALAGLPNVSVSVASAGPGATCCAWIAGARTRADGTYDLILANGTYRLRFQASSGAYLAAWFDNAPPNKSLFSDATDVVVSGTNVAAVDVTLASGFHIRGRLTSTTGTPAVGISVNAYQGGTAACCTWVVGTVTDANGDYDLIVAAGTYRIWFYPTSGTWVSQWFSGAATHATATDITVGPDQSGKNGSLVGGP